MNVTTLEAPSSGTRSSRGTLGALIVAALAAITFVALAALPYVRLTEAQYGPYYTRRGWLMLHIAGGIVAILTGPVQLWLGLTDQRPALHRRLGVTYLAAVLVGSIGGFYMALTTTFGWVFGAGLAGLAIAWVVTTGMAFLAIKRSLFDQHKEWMIRSYVVTFAFVIFRVTSPALQQLNVGTASEQLAVAAWGCWAIPLLITEVIMQGRTILAVRA